MDAVEIIKLIGLILSGVVTTLVPSIIVIVQKVKQLKEAKTTAEKIAAINDMLAEVNILIEYAEAFVESGTRKKAVVLTKLEQYAEQNKYEFDANYWGEKIDEIVAFTKEVNAKQ